MSKEYLALKRLEYIILWFPLKMKANECNARLLN